MTEHVCGLKGSLFLVSTVALSHFKASLAQNLDAEPFMAGDHSAGFGFLGVFLYVILIICCCLCSFLIPFWLYSKLMKKDSQLPVEQRYMKSEITLLWWLMCFFVSCCANIVMYFVIDSEIERRLAAMRNQGAGRVPVGVNPVYAQPTQATQATQGNWKGQNISGVQGNQQSQPTQGVQPCPAIPVAQVVESPPSVQLGGFAHLSQQQPQTQPQRQQAAATEETKSIHIQ